MSESSAICALSSNSDDVSVKEMQVKHLQSIFDCKDGFFLSTSDDGKNIGSVTGVRKLIVSGTLPKLCLM